MSHFIRLFKNLGENTLTAEIEPCYVRFKGISEAFGEYS